MTTCGLLLLMSYVKSYWWSFFPFDKFSKFEFIQNGKTQMNSFYLFATDSKTRTKIRMHSCRMRTTRSYRGGGTCTAGGHAWQGACMAGGHAWQRGNAWQGDMWAYMPPCHTPLPVNRMTDKQVYIKTLPSQTQWSVCVGGKTGIFYCMDLTKDNNKACLGSNLCVIFETSEGQQNCTFPDGTATFLQFQFLALRVSVWNSLDPRRLMDK